MAKSWPEFYADYDVIKIFWKFWDFDQNNPILKFDTFLAIISTCLDNNVPKFGVHGSFLTLNKMSEKDFEISKILQNLGIKSESRHYIGYLYPKLLVDLTRIHSSQVQTKDTGTVRCGLQCC